MPCPRFAVHMAQRGSIRTQIRLRKTASGRTRLPPQSAAFDADGGLLGICAIRFPLQTKSSRANPATHLADSPEDFVESIKAMVDAVGVDHVGIGTDTNLLSSCVGQGTNKVYPNLAGGFFSAVVGEMLRQGFTPDDIGKVGGGNYCRVFDKVTAE